MTRREALVFGLSEVASAVAHRLHGAGWRMALAADRPPKVHRRAMTFADVWWDDAAILEGLSCLRSDPERLVHGDWLPGVVTFIALETQAALTLKPWPLVIDARLAKRAAPLGLRGRAGLTIGCGPGHVAGETCDLAIETQWGDDLGAVIIHGPTASLAGEPRAIAGIGRDRIVYAPVAGQLTVLRDIGNPVAAGESVARIGETVIAAPVTGTLRGMMRDGIAIARGDKLCEVDPRTAGDALFTGIGQRPAAIAAGVLRAVETAHLLR